MHGRRGRVLPGMVRLRLARFCAVWQARHGVAWIGQARRSGAGMEVLGKVQTSPEVIGTAG